MTRNFITLHTEIARRLAALHTTPYTTHQRPLAEQPPLTAEAVVTIDELSAELSAGAEAVRAASFARITGGDVAPTPAERAELGGLRTACSERLAAALGAESAHHLVMRSEARLLRGGPASIEQVRPELRALALAEELAWHVVDRLRAELAAREAELRARARALAVDLRLCASLGLVVDDPSAPPAFRDAIFEALMGPAPQMRVLKIFEPHVAAAAAADGSLYQVEVARLAALRAAINDPRAPEIRAWEHAIAAQSALQGRYAHLG